MEKITLRQFLEFTNLYVPIYIEDEFQRHTTELDWPGHLLKVLGDKMMCSTTNSACSSTRTVGHIGSALPPLST